MPKMRASRFLLGLATIVRALLLMLAGLMSAQAEVPAHAQEPFEAALVSVGTGSLQGSIQNGVHVFKGVPYAAPPVGDMRWKEPVPAVMWEGVKNALNYGPACPQNSAGQDAIPVGSLRRQSEDCLDLNIWSPAKTPAANLPVMVWLHGGWFSRGSGSQYPGLTLAKRENVIVVTINYRLGPFGFLALPALTRESSHSSSGNYGLLDQMAALRWVKSNIGAFGGDPSRVTLFGQSAGGFSVCDLIVSPLARGLFDRAIMQSGRCEEHLPSLAYKERRGQKIAANLNCADGGKPLACLRAKSAADILSGAKSAAGYAVQGNYFNPNLDGYVFTKSPRASIDDNNLAQVPILLGTVAQEASRYLPNIATQSDWRIFAQKIWRNRAEQVEALYPVTADSEAAAAAEQAMTDYRYACPAWQTAMALQANGNPVYLYTFTHAPLHGDKKVLGAYHAVENGYVFGNLHAAPDRDIGPADYALSAQLSRYWATFAATGNPNSPGQPPWLAFSPEHPRVQRLDTDITSANFSKSSICMAWERIAPV
jgi:para-nitrobenzyl esterase